LDLFFLAAHALGAIVGTAAGYAGWLRIQGHRLREKEREVLAQWREVARQRNEKLHSWIEHAHGHQALGKELLRELEALSRAPEEEHSSAFLRREERMAETLSLALALLKQEGSKVPRLKEAHHGLERFQHQAQALQESFRENRGQRESLESHLFSWLAEE